MSTDTVRIPIGVDICAVVDVEDAELAHVRWYRKEVGRKGRTKHIYAARNEFVGGKRVTIYLHRVVAGAQKGDIADHIDGNTLNNCRSNLRLVDRYVNAQNRTSYPRGTSTGIRGVSKSKDGGYVASVYHLGKKVWRKRFSDIETATSAVTEARRIYFPDAAPPVPSGQGGTHTKARPSG